jgi:hypothetical protein
MTDNGFYLVVAYLFLAPSLVRWVRGPNSLAWPAFFLGIALVALYFLDWLHLDVPAEIGQPLIFVLMLALIVRLALDLFPRDRANRP